MAGLSVTCPGCCQEIQIPSATECRRALHVQANNINGSWKSEVRTHSSATAAPAMDRPVHLPDHGLAGKTPAAAAEDVAEPALCPEQRSAPVTKHVNAVERLKLLVWRSDRVGTGALLLCGAALLCAFSPRTCGLVIPLSVAGALVGLSGLILVLFAAEKRLFLPFAGAIGSVLVLIAASFLPKLLGPAYMTWQAKGSLDPMAIRAIPISGSHESSASLDADWVDATKASLQLGPVNVQVVSVSIRRAEAVKSSSDKKIAPGDYCFVRIRTQEQVAAGQFSAKRSQMHESHIEDASLKLTDSVAKSYELQGVLKADVMDKQAVPQ